MARKAVIGGDENWTFVSEPQVCHALLARFRLAIFITQVTNGFQLEIIRGTTNR